MAAWFARHESDLNSEAADDYLKGEGEITAGQVAWLLWGGDLSKENRMRSQEWAQRQVDKLEEEKQIGYEFYGWDDPTVKFLGLPQVKKIETEEQKQIYWKEIDNLRSRWESTLENLYAKELNRQKREVAKVIRKSSNLNDMDSKIDKVIDSTNFEKEFLPLYYSLSDDFSVRTFDSLIPKSEQQKAADPVDLGVSIDEQETITTVMTTTGSLLGMSGRSINNIVEEGFYRRQRNVPAAVGSLFTDGQSANFLQENAKSVMKDLNRTTKKIISRIVETSLKELEELGIVNPVAGTPDGDKFFDSLARKINVQLGGQSLKRSRTIARTEVLKASSWAQQRAAKSTGKVLEKEWVSQRDNLVRDSHFELDNQRVPADSFYLYNGIKLDFPGDPKAPAGLVVNCRCTEAFVEVIDE